ncbi:unnamed protein product [Closterium sp. NIES-54]
MHSRHAHTPCTHAMHTRHALTPCTHAMHSRHALTPCTHAMHSRHALTPCTRAMHIHPAHPSPTDLQPRSTHARPLSPVGASHESGESSVPGSPLVVHAPHHLLHLRPQPLRLRRLCCQPRLVGRGEGRVGGEQGGHGNEGKGGGRGEHRPVRRERVSSPTTPPPTPLLPAPPGVEGEGEGGTEQGGSRRASAERE